MNGNESLPIPADAFAMRGAGGQSTTIIPSHGLVIVKQAKYRGSRELLMEAVPAVEEGS